MTDEARKESVEIKYETPAEIQQRREEYMAFVRGKDPAKAVASTLELYRIHFDVASRNLGLTNAQKESLLDDSTYARLSPLAQAALNKAASNGVINGAPVQTMGSILSCAEDREVAALNARKLDDPAVVRAARADLMINFLFDLKDAGKLDVSTADGWRIQDLEEGIQKFVQDDMKWNKDLNRYASVSSQNLAVKDVVANHYVNDMCKPNKPGLER